MPLPTFNWMPFAIPMAHNRSTSAPFESVTNSNTDEILHKQDRHEAQKKGGEELPSLLQA